MPDGPVRPVGWPPAAFGRQAVAMGAADQRATSAAFLPATGSGANPPGASATDALPAAKAIE